MACHLTPAWHQVITETNADILSIGTWGTYFNQESKYIIFWENAFQSVVCWIAAILLRPLWVYSLRPSDAIWQSKSESSLTQVMAITWTKADQSSVRSCGIHLRAISQEMFHIFILDINSEITDSRSQSHLPGTKELIPSPPVSAGGACGSVLMCSIPPAGSLTRCWLRAMSQLILRTPAEQAG